MSRRDKAIFPLLKNLSVDFNAFLLERSWHRRSGAVMPSVQRVGQVGYKAQDAVLGGRVLPGMQEYRDHLDHIASGGAGTLTPH